MLNGSERVQVQLHLATCDPSKDFETAAGSCKIRDSLMIKELDLYSGYSMLIYLALYRIEGSIMSILYFPLVSPMKQ
jgi:hypothetical protein